MSNILQVRGFEILDSRGNPTVAAEVVLSDGARGFAASPSGASTGSREAIELRDGDPKRYLGKGVVKAVGNINGELSKLLVGRASQDQAALDQRMIELTARPTRPASEQTPFWPCRWHWRRRRRPHPDNRSTDTWARELRPGCRFR